MFFEDPKFFFTIAAIIPTAVWVVAIVGWLIADEVSPIEGIIALLMVVGIYILVVKADEPMVSLGAAMGLIVGGALYPLTRSALNARAHIKIDVDMMKAAYRMLDAKEANVGAKVQLSKLCYKRGLIGPAIALLDDAVNSAPALLEDERKLLTKWQSDHKHLQSRELRCPRCTAVNPAANRYCQRCGTATLLKLAGGGLILSGTPLKAFWIWVLTVSALVGVPFLASSLSPGLAALTIVLVFLASGLLFYRILRGTEQ